jgi:hypothetical protein
MMSDKALEAFLNTAKKNELDLPEELLTSIYEIEKKYQYRDKSDRGVVTKEIQNLVDDYFSSSKA